MSTLNVGAELIGSSGPMVDLRARIAVAARSDAKVLITGESGTGKEVTARLLHQHSPRRANAMLAINCAAVTDGLLESELFGHVRGSFTGALADRGGLLESANGGTALLDEVGEMSARMQGLLLRFLDSGEIQRVGDDRNRTRVNVRVVAATNRSLPDRVSSGDFRLDLFYRLNVIQLHMPPLRERAEDVAELMDAFLGRYATQYAVTPPTLTSSAVRALEGHEWRGNVRELRNVAERLTVDAHGRIVDDSDLGMYLSRPGSDPRPTAGTRLLPEDLVARMVMSGASFWSVVAAPFLSRDLTRDDLRAVIRLGLERTGGSYRRLVSLFNFGDSSERRLLIFLRRYRCDVTREALSSPGVRPGPAKS